MRIMDSRVSERRWLGVGSLAALLSLACFPPPASTDPHEQDATERNEIMGVPPNGQVRERLDEFRRLTVLTAEIPVEHGLSVQLLGIPDAPDSTGLVIFSVEGFFADGWHYLECHNLDLLLDGTPAHVTSEHDGSVSNSGGGVHEQVKANINIAAVERIARAGVVRGRVCNDVWTLNTAELGVLRRFAARYRELSPRPPAPILDAGASLAPVAIDAGVAADASAVRTEDSAVPGPL